jgi:perosamine synthetase
VLADLLDQGIEARIYFPPVHRQPIFARRDGGTGDAAALPVTEAVARAMLSLPVHHRLTEAEVTEIADAVTTAVGRATASPNAADQPMPVGAR